MKIQYKNKRDFYKSLAEKNARLLEESRKEILKLKEKKEQKKSISYFCSECRTVGSGTIGIDIAVIDCKCPNCGAFKLLAVSKIKY